MEDRILVADDNRDVADALVRLLTALGYEARAVYSGEEAVKAAAEFQPEMAFIDIGMPGLNGYDTVARIRQRGSNHVILVALTGWTQREDKLRAYESGFDLHVAKPMTIDTLEELLALLDPTARTTSPERVHRVPFSQCA